MSDDFEDVDDATFQSVKDEIVELVLTGRVATIPQTLKVKFASGEFVRGVLRHKESSKPEDFDEGRFIWNGEFPNISDIEDYSYCGAFEDMDIFSEERIEEIIETGMCTKAEWCQFLHWWIQSAFDDIELPSDEPCKFYEIVPITSSNGKKCWHLMVSTYLAATNHEFIEPFIGFFQTIESAKTYLRLNGLIDEDLRNSTVVEKFIERNIASETFCK